MKNEYKQTRTLVYAVLLVPQKTPTKRRQAMMIRKPLKEAIQHLRNENVLVELLDYREQEAGLFERPDYPTHWDLDAQDEPAPELAEMNESHRNVNWA